MKESPPKDDHLMIDDVLGIPDQLRDALWRIESARLEPAAAAGVMVCGMGGSAIGGDLAAAALGDRLTKPFFTVRGYELPSWATPEWTLLCSSYSGLTEEALACFAAGEALGARRVVASTGGPLVAAAREAGVPVVGLPGIFQPRAAVAYMFAVALEVAALAGAAPRLHTEIDAAAAFLSAEAEALQSRAAEIAARLAGAIPVVYGADLTAPIAHRWKTQANENAKLPSFYSELPEADHNEICGWAGAAGVDRLAAVFLEDRDQHPRARRRFELTAATVAADAAAVVRVETAGETRVARLMWATMLGDLVSLKLAEERGVDPFSIEPIERFKQAMGQPDQPVR
jgi:glucose/mannose-6-phosphate isomerase